VPSRALPYLALRDLFRLTHGKPGWGCLRQQLPAFQWEQLVEWDDEQIGRDHRLWERRELANIKQKVSVWLDEMRAESMFPKVKDDGRLTEDQLERARTYPMPDLVGPSKHGRIPCPWHKGHDANMAVYQTGVKCFVCGASADPIKWVMEMEGLSFTSAVRKLAGV
jgi:hypothetical protein